MKSNRNTNGLSQFKFSFVTGIHPSSNKTETERKILPTANARTRPSPPDRQTTNPRVSCGGHCWLSSVWNPNFPKGPIIKVQSSATVCVCTEWTFQQLRLSSEIPRTDVVKHRKSWMVYVHKPLGPGEISRKALTVSWVLMGFRRVRTIVRNLCSG